MQFLCGFINGLFRFINGKKWDELGEICVNYILSALHHERCAKSLGSLLRIWKEKRSQIKYY